VVAALEPPRRYRRVVHGAVQREVGLRVPLQPIDDRTGPADAQIRGELVPDRIRDDVPVAGWRLRARAIRPELHDRAVVVTRADEIGGVWRERHRILRETAPAVRTESVAADPAG